MGNNHLKWFDETKRKILILSFEELYLQKISKYLSNIDIQINEAIGFQIDNVIYKKLILRLWYLNVNNRHLWKHYYIGTQGIIIMFSFQKKVRDRKIIFEVMNILNDENIIGIPILVLIDVNSQEQEIIEFLRKGINLKMSEDSLKMVKFYCIDFDNDINQMKIGVDWLCENMKPFKG